MSFRLSLMIGLTGVLVAAACGGQPAPPPQPAVNTDSIRRADSIAREEARRRASADSIARERAERERVESQRRADSLARIEATTRRMREALSARVHFDFDRAEIRAGDRANLDVKISIMRANAGLTISIVGHADERGSDEYNLALGNRRALAAKAYMVQRGIAADRITTSSMGEEQPMAMGSNEEAWAQNRRAEFTISAGGNMLVAPAGM